jgi:hypothetical protein
MPRWSNRSLVAYHGTDTGSLTTYGALGHQSLHSQLFGFSINIAACRPNTDFGRGFYLTSYLHQARQWANDRVRRKIAANQPVPKAVVLSFTVDRNLLASAEGLAFVLATNDYWDLVSDCRVGFTPLSRTGANPAYDVVYGPVALWQQQLIIHDCDQVSIHTQTIANRIPAPVVHDIATNASGLF